MLKVWIVLKRLKNIARAIIYYWTYRDMADKMGKYWRSSLLIIVKGVMKGYRTPYLIGAVIASLQAKKLQYKKVYLFEFGVASGGGLLELIKISSILNN